MKYGLSGQQLQEITGILGGYDEIEAAVLFGSRVMDTWKEASDVDIAIKGEKADLYLAARLKAHFEEETYLPFFFDVIAWNTIKSEALKKQIRQKGKVIYRRGWREMRLGEIVDVVGGGTPKTNVKEYWDGEIPWLSPPDFTNSNRWVEKTQKTITKLGLNNSSTKMIDKGDLIISARGTVGALGQLKKPMAFSQTNYGLKADPKFTNNDFLFYLLKHNLKIIKQFSHGAVFDTITTATFNEIEICLPSPSEQKAIAEVLGSLDDKIDLLHRQNKTLESLAETLFRQWFVEEADEEWEKGTLKDEFEILMGQSPPGSSYNEEKIGMPMYQGNKDFGYRFPSNRVFTSEPKRIAEKYDTLISVRAPVGAQNMANEECCIGRGVAAFRHKSFPEFYSYTYFKLGFMLDDIKNFNHEGTVFGSISKSDFEKIETEIPTQSDLQKIQSLLKPIDDKVASNSKQIQTLEKLRDTLLPKLMSGEVRVNHQ